VISLLTQIFGFSKEGSKLLHASRSVHPAASQGSSGVPGKENDASLSRKPAVHCKLAFRRSRQFAERVQSNRDVTRAGRLEFLNK
jgi:hypothetical protein